MSAKNYDHTNFGCGNDPDYDENDKSLGRNVGGDRSWSHPVYATDGNGDPVTVSFGQGNRKARRLLLKDMSSTMIFMNVIRTEGLSDMNMRMAKET